MSTKEDSRKRNAAWRARLSPEKKAALKEYMRSWRAANKETLAEKSKEYRAKNAERIRARKRAVYSSSRAKDRNSKYYAANADRLSLQSRRYYQLNAEERREYAKAFRDKNVDILRVRRGLPPPTRAEPEHCELCGRHRGDRRLHLDHCHELNLFRSWLCGRCNTAIGMLGDNAAALQRAADFLRRRESSMALELIAKHPAVAAAVARIPFRRRLEQEQANAES